MSVTLGMRSGVNDLDPDQVYTYPCAGTTGVQPRLTDETPNPIPLNLTQDYKLYGSGIVVKVRVGKVLKVTGATLSPVGGGAPIATTTVDRTNDPQADRYTWSPDSVAFLLPMTVLLPFTSYNLTVTGTSDGKAFTKKLAKPFTTGVMPVY
jgi:hypothetical protein